MAFQSDGNDDLYNKSDDTTNNLSASFSSSVHLKDIAAEADPLPAASISSTSRHPSDTTMDHSLGQTQLEEQHTIDDGNKTMTSASFLSPETALQSSQSSNQIQRRLSTGNSPHGDGTSSDTLVKAIDNAASITPDELMPLLLTSTKQQLRPLLIDIRYQPNYEDASIRGSIHVNMPSLLLKRYRRGTVSNFSLESFITTPQGMEDYSKWMKQQQQDIGTSSLSSMVVVYDDVMDTRDKTTSAWTLVGALSTFFSGGNMDGGNRNSIGGEVKNNIKAKVVWLQGGFTAFEQKDTAAQYLEKPSTAQYQHQDQTSESNRFDFGSTDTHPSLSTQNDLSTFWNSNNGPLAAETSSNNNSLSIPKVVPVLSRSATTFSSAPHLSSSNNNMQRRSSLFTLDTTNVRNKHRSPSQVQTTTTGAGAVPTFRNPRRRRQDRNTGNNAFETTLPETAPTPTASATTGSTNQQKEQLSRPLSEDNAPRLPSSSPPPPTGALSDSQLQQQHLSIASNKHANSLAHMPPPPPPPHEDKEPHINNTSDTMDCDESYEDDGLESEQEPTPMTENEYAFIVSAIVPDFLYLGPEISTVEQMEGLKEQSIKRILNMAEECDDDVPGLKSTFKYSKVAARDTVEMQNVEDTLRRAVHIIDDAKKHHEAIYVHCKAGKSRSVAVILAYFVLSEHWSLRRAYKHVIKARPWVSPNIGFVAELIKLEESALGHASNFAGTDWHKVDITSPPSPASQKEIGMVQRAWRHSISAAAAKAKVAAAAAAAAVAATTTASSSSIITGSTSSPTPTPASSSSPSSTPRPPQYHHQQPRQQRHGSNQQQQHHHNRYTTT